MIIRASERVVVVGEEAQVCKKLPLIHPNRNDMFTITSSHVLKEN